MSINAVCLTLDVDFYAFGRKQPFLPKSVSSLHKKTLPKKRKRFSYLNSQKATAAAAATFSESTPCFMGILTV